MVWEYIGKEEYELNLLFKGQKYNVLKIAEKCQNIWTQFIQNHKLKVSLPEKIKKLFSIN